MHYSPMTTNNMATLTCFNAYGIRGRLGAELSEDIPSCIGCVKIINDPHLTWTSIDVRQQYGS